MLRARRQWGGVEMQLDSDCMWKDRTWNPGFRPEILGLSLTKVQILQEARLWRGWREWGRDQEAKV